MAKVLLILAAASAVTLVDPFPLFTKCPSLPGDKGQGKQGVTYGAPGGKKRLGSHPSVQLGKHLGAEGQPSLYGIHVSVGNEDNFGLLAEIYGPLLTGGGHRVTGHHGLRGKSSSPYGALGVGSLNMLGGQHRSPYDTPHMEGGYKLREKPPNPYIPNESISEFGKFGSVESIKWNGDGMGSGEASRSYVAPGSLEFLYNIGGRSGFGSGSYGGYEPQVLGHKEISLIRHSRSSGGGGISKPGGSKAAGRRLQR